MSELNEQLWAHEAPQAAQLEVIAKSIGYGRSCQILGELWDQMLEREYGRPSTRGKMERRRDIEAIEAVIKSATPAPQAAPSGLTANLHEAVRLIVEGYNYGSGYYNNDSFVKGLEKLFIASGAYLDESTDKYKLPAVTQAAPSEPVAAERIECRQPVKPEEIWHEFISRTKPSNDNPRRLRNVTPLYAAPLAAQQSPADIPQADARSWTLLLTGEHSGLVGKAGCEFKGHHEQFERVTVSMQQSPADARDAARYRWLRDNCYDTDPKGEGDSFDHPFLQFESEDLAAYDESSLDAAIDAAIAAATTSTEGR